MATSSEDHTILKLQNFSREKVHPSAGQRRHRELQPCRSGVHKNIADRNKVNRSHQSMPYRKGRKSQYQLKDDFRLAHDREPNRVEIFKIGRCKELPDGNEQWVDDESMSRYERIIQLSTPSLDSESGSTPISAEAAFVSVMRKD
ncbi:hypothetical protein Taro_047519 [Colocasia esculenta]|uniref:Uncharacterized protein n=1 Tax=Colocasia esculenta TaxID=4460 RepID=A0A843X164_COLES|nr:hypothetical protein [Colocasia esculenta]